MGSHRFGLLSGYRHLKFLMDFHGFRYDPLLNSGFLQKPIGIHEFPWGIHGENFL